MFAPFPGFVVPLPSGSNASRVFPEIGLCALYTFTADVFQMTAVAGRDRIVPIDTRHKETDHVRGLTGARDVKKRPASLLISLQKSRLTQQTQVA